ncbi:MAG TPA: hypothetical protein VFB19_16160 [Mycobacterium sp.]|nr:hypothetical protein [Mycobacterium sp.]
MSTQPEDLRTEIAALLDELPDLDEGIDVADLDIDAIATRLEEAHDVLVRALESVDPTSVPAPSA